MAWRRSHRVPDQRPEASTPIFIGIDYSADYLNEQALARVAGLLDSDPMAATMVAATINTRQAAGESGPAFVKRIVRLWLEEMGR